MEVQFEGKALESQLPQALFIGVLVCIIGYLLKKVNTAASLLPHFVKNA